MPKLSTYVILVALSLLMFFWAPAWSQTVTYSKISDLPLDGAPGSTDLVEIEQSTGASSNSATLGSVIQRAHGLSDGHLLIDSGILSSVSAADFLTSIGAAALVHDHDADYSAVDHDHDSDYASADHNHDADYAAAAHNHATTYAALVHDHDSDYSAIDHNHDEDYQAADLDLGSLAQGIDGVVVGAGNGNGFAAGTYDDIVALFGTGACSGYMKSDGTCDEPEGLLGNWNYTPLEEEPETPQAGKFYLADNNNWDPIDYAGETDYFVMYTGVGWIGVIDMAGNILLANIPADDTAYDATSWNSDTNAPSKNAVRDEMETKATRVASGTSALGVSAIPSNACAAVVTTSASGTVTTDVIGWGFNGDPTGTTGYQASTDGMLTIIAYPSTDNVNFRVCNNTAAAITPGAITLNWRVIR